MVDNNYEHIMLQIMIAATKHHGSFFSDVAIDDVTITPSPCILAGTKYSTRNRYISYHHMTQSEIIDNIYIVR